MATGKAPPETGRTHIRTYPPFDSARAFTGKFLQLELDGAPWMIFATRDMFRYHNQILAAFLAEQGVAHRWPAPDTLDYDRRRVRVDGGGRFDLDLGLARLELWDNSTAYGRFGEERIRVQISAAAPPWSELSVFIRKEGR